MEFRQSVKLEPQSLLNNSVGGNEDLIATYPFALQLYEKPPIGELSLQEFGDFAVARLKVLRLIEKARLKQVKGTKEYIDDLTSEIRREDLRAFYKSTPDDSESTELNDYLYRRQDHISHYILRLAFCKTEELRRWFIREETELFDFRFKNESRKQLTAFMNYHNMNFEPISESEKLRVHDAVRKASYGEVFLTESTDFYKVEFTEILDLVAKRKVYLEGGYGYVKIKDMHSIITARFRSNLSRSLAILAKVLPNLEEDTRLLPLLADLHSHYIGDDYTTCSKSTEGQITRHMIDGLSVKSFPLCMRQLHEAFRQNHHLKHGGRLQYSLFLKGLGMTLEDVLAMWREEFSKIMDADKFEKQYSYNIRHSYGKEGKRANYTPMNCMKIIMNSAPSIGDHHGCPFRHNDQALLKQKLSSYKISSSGIQEVMDLVSRGHYQIACSRHFELTHQTTLKQSISHPNQYAEESVKLTLNLSQPRKEIEGTKNTESTSQPSQDATQSSHTTFKEDSSVFMEDDDMDSICATIDTSWTEQPSTS